MSLQMNIIYGLLFGLSLLTGCATQQKGDSHTDKASKTLIDSTQKISPVIGMAFDAFKARVAMSTPEREALAKKFAVIPDKANVYVFRSEVTFGAAIKSKVDIDGKRIGKMSGGTFLLVEMEPGKHTITGIAENDSVLEITAEAGKNYYVWQEMKMGFITLRNKLQLLEEEAGKESVLGCGLIEQKLTNL